MVCADPTMRRSFDDVTIRIFNRFIGVRPARQFLITILTALILISMPAPAAPILQPGPPGTTLA